MLYNKRYKYYPRFFRKTYEKALDFVTIGREDTILEIGCGGGIFLSRLMQHSSNVFGIDVNESAIKKLDEKNCMVMSAERLEFDKNCFDKIYSIHVMEHIPDAGKALSEIYRVLKPNGKAILIYPFEPIRGISEFVNSLMAYYHPFAGHKFHLHNLSPKKIRVLAEKNGFRVIKDGIFFADFGPWPQFFSILGKYK